jgi:rare lipoprotein A
MKRIKGLAGVQSRLADRRSLRVACVVGLAALVANCSGSGSKIDPKYGVAASPRVVAEGQPVPKGGGRYQVGKPYTVAGRTFVPTENKNYRAEGLASWYGSDFHGRLTANGEVFDRHSLTAAHPTLPLPSYVRVTNTANGRSVIVRVNDRGPFHGNRVLDVSRRTAEVLDFQRRGTARVKVEYAGPADINGSDDQRLMATYRDDGSAAPVPTTAIAMAAPQPTTAPVASAAAAPVLASAAPVAANVMAQGAVPMPVPSPVKVAVVAAPSTVSHGPAATHVAAPALPAPVRLAMAAPSAQPAQETVSQRVSSTWAQVGEPMSLINPAAAASGPALAISSGR